MGQLAGIVVYLIFVAIYSVVITQVIPKRLYTLSNCLIAAGSIGFGLIYGLSLPEMGLALAGFVKTLPVVLVIILLIGIGISLAYLILPLRQLMSDGPSKQQANNAWHDLLVRIPFGTALSEEVIFRGVLLGILMSHWDQTTALVISSIAFGIWHVVPTLKTVRANDAFKGLVGSSQRHHALSIFTTVLSTTAAGFVFGWLRIFTGNLAASWIVHTFINGFAVGNAYVWLFIKKLRKIEGQQP